MCFFLIEVVLWVINRFLILVMFYLDSVFIIDGFGKMWMEIKFVNLILKRYVGFYFYFYCKDRVLINGEFDLKDI